MRPDTPNSTRYHFCDFTHAAYERLLALAARQYRFRLYHDFEPHETFVLWRHDLDFGIEDALPLARMEADAGVRCTYFVNMRSEFYNAFEARSLRAIAAIAGLGHAIGLHFDFGLAGVSDAAGLERCLRREAAILADEYGLPVQAFSFHNPTEAALAFDAPAYAGLVNTYAAGFRRDVAYCSDSNGHWRFDRLEDVLSRPATRPLQVLTHPTWWTPEVMSPHEKVQRTVGGAASALLAGYEALLARHGRKDIDW